MSRSLHASPAFDVPIAEHPLATEIRHSVRTQAHIFCGYIICNWVERSTNRRGIAEKEVAQQ